MLSPQPPSALSALSLTLTSPVLRLGLRLSSTGLCALLLAACASNSSNGGVIIDTKYVDMSAYRQDLSECQSYAAQVNTGATVAKSSGTAAAIGGAIGAIVGNSSSAAKGAGSGAVLGAAKGMGKASREKDKVIKSCLRGRGYRVLN